MCVQQTLRIPTDQLSVALPYKSIIHTVSDEFDKSTGQTFARVHKILETCTDASSFPLASGGWPSGDVACAALKRNSRNHRCATHECGKTGETPTQVRQDRRTAHTSDTPHECGKTGETPTQERRQDKRNAHTRDVQPMSAARQAKRPHKRGETPTQL